MMRRVSCYPLTEIEYNSWEYSLMLIATEDHLRVTLIKSGNSVIIIKASCNYAAKLGGTAGNYTLVPFLL